MGGMIVLATQELIILFRTNKRLKSERMIRIKSLKSISKEVLYQLNPSANLELMRDLLGTPFRQNNTDYQVFSENETVTNSYIYTISKMHM